MLAVEQSKRNRVADGNLRFAMGMLSCLALPNPSPLNHQNVLIEKALDYKTLYLYKYMCVWLNIHSHIYIYKYVFVCLGVQGRSQCFCKQHTFGGKQAAGNYPTPAVSVEQWRANSKPLEVPLTLCWSGKK